VTAGEEKLADGPSPSAAIVAEFELARTSTRRNPPAREKFEQRIAFRPAGMLFSPEKSFAGVVGVLGAAACIAPWLARGWRWFVVMATSAATLSCFDALALWLAREECAPVLLSPENALRGREGETIRLPLALAGSYRNRVRHRMRSEVSVGIMPATQGGETAIQVKSEPQRLKLAHPDPTAAASTSPNTKLVQLWPWTPEVALLRRGVWPGPRVGIEKYSRFGLWHVRQWFDSPVPLRIDADLRASRQDILRSPVYRALVAARQSPWTGHGREFERLREYQPGDMYSEIAWKSTARRGTPVTRLFQWEQKQEVYFVVDQSRASAHAYAPVANSDDNASQTRSPRRLLDLAVETALVGASVALEVGDAFGLITFADEPKSWLLAGSGQSHFHLFRDRLRNLEPLPTTADYETLFAEISLRLRRRAYLVLLADLTERSVADSLSRGVSLIRSSHAVLLTSILPAHARPAFSPGEKLDTDQDVYTALAGEKENQRLGALARQLRRSNAQLRYVPAELFLRKAIEGYLENKREQRL
jgi:uncharacterized protein (DUF58 family)